MTWGSHSPPAALDLRLIFGNPELGSREPALAVYVVLREFAVGFLIFTVLAWAIGPHCNSPGSRANTPTATCSTRRASLHSATAEGGSPSGCCS